MEKDISEIIESHIECIAKSRALDAMNDLFIVADTKPGAVVIFSSDDRFDDWQKEVNLSDFIKGLIADCGPEDSSDHILLAWGQWMIKAGENMIRQAKANP